MHLACTSPAANLFPWVSLHNLIFLTMLLLGELYTCVNLCIIFFSVSETVDTLPIKLDYKLDILNFNWEKNSELKEKLNNLRAKLQNLTKIWWKFEIIQFNRTSLNLKSGVWDQSQQLSLFHRVSKNGFDIGDATTK